MRCHCIPRYSPLGGGCSDNLSPAKVFHTHLEKKRETGVMLKSDLPSQVLNLPPHFHMLRSIIVPWLRYEYDYGSALVFTLYITLDLPPTLPIPPSLFTVHRPPSTVHALVLSTSGYAGRHLSKSEPLLIIFYSAAESRVKPHNARPVIKPNKPPPLPGWLILHQSPFDRHRLDDHSLPLWSGHLPALLSPDSTFPGPQTRRIDEVVRILLRIDPQGTNDISHSKTP